jgi:hypothetical protein
MSKLRIKISGCLRSMAGAEEFCALRSHLATAARHGTGALDAPTTAFQGQPWIPKPDNRAQHQRAPAARARIAANLSSCTARALDVTPIQSAPIRRGAGMAGVSEGRQT